VSTVTGTVDTRQNDKIVVVIAYPGDPAEIAPTTDAPSPTALLPTAAPPCDKNDTILDDQIGSTRRGGYQKFLVHWKNHPSSDDSWIKTEEVQRLDPDLYDAYVALYSSESSSLPRGGN
jgi:hypothetical protein